jgi:hypothetical protein
MEDNQVRYIGKSIKKAGVIMGFAILLAAGLNGWALIFFIVILLYS